MKALENNQILEQHGIKPCVVKVKQNIFRKIKIGCSASIDGVKLSCKMIQTGTNSFDIKVIRNETPITDKSGLFQINHDYLYKYICEISVMVERMIYYLIIIL